MPFRFALMLQLPQLVRVYGYQKRSPKALLASVK